MSEITSVFAAQLRAADQWDTIAVEDTQEEAEAVMLSRLSKVRSQGRVIEVRTTIDRTIVNRAGYMGDTDEEIVKAVIEGRHL